jgi:hypothetical protein
MPYSAMILERGAPWQSGDHGGELNEYPLRWGIQLLPDSSVMACKLDSHNRAGGLAEGEGSDVSAKSR